LQNPKLLQHLQPRQFQKVTTAPQKKLTNGKMLTLNIFKGGIFHPFVFV
jgi:hypothetical protein